MAIIDPMSDVFTPLLPTTAQTVVFSSTTMSDFESGLDAFLAKSPSKRNTEPLIEADPLTDEVAIVLLDDATVVEESTDTDVLEELPLQSRHARASTARTALG